MTVGIDDAFRLLQQILVDLLSATELYTVIRPRRTFGLQIDTQFIGSGKGSLGRTIGMEPHMVQTILLDLRENTDPRGLVRGGITRLGETTVLHRTAQPHGVVVDIQLSAFYPHLAQAEGGLVIVIAHSDTDLIELGGELIPQTEHLPDGDTHGDGIAGNLQIVHQTDAILISQRHDCHRHILIVVQRIMVTIQQHGDMYLIVHRLWTDLHLFDAHPLRLGPQFHPSGDAVPVALRLVGHAMRVLSHTHILDTVIHTDSDGVTLTRHQLFGHIKLMGRRERHLVAYVLAVDKDKGLDMRTLQEECDALALPVLWDIDTLLIPRLAHIVFLGGQEERELHVFLPPILLHPGIEVVRRIVGRSRPTSVNRHRITLVVRQHRPRQHHVVEVMYRVVERQVP